MDGCGLKPQKKNKQQAANKHAAFEERSAEESCDVSNREFLPQLGGRDSLLESF